MKTSILPWCFTHKNRPKTLWDLWSISKITPGHYHISIWWFWCFLGLRRPLGEKRRRWILLTNSDCFTCFGLIGTLPEVLAQLGVCLCGGCPKFWPWSTPKGPKWSKNAQKWPTSDYEHSGGPKRLKWHETSYRTSWLRFWHSWECVCRGGVPIFGPAAPKKGQNGPKMAKI